MKVYHAGEPLSFPGLVLLSSPLIWLSSAQTSAWPDFFHSLVFLFPLCDTHIRRDGLARSRASRIPYGHPCSKKSSARMLYVYNFKVHTPFSSFLVRLSLLSLFRFSLSFLSFSFSPPVTGRLKGPTESRHVKIRHL